MKSYIFIKKSDLPTLPENFNSDGRFAPQLVQKLIERYSKEGDSIFDPFLGYGTTVYIAEILNRVGYGIELDRERFNYSVSICKNVNKQASVLTGIRRSFRNFRCSLFHSFCLCACFGLQDQR